MESLVGQRVFFKRKALSVLKGYWCQRWDNAPLRQALSLRYTPKYHVVEELLGGYYVRLRYSDLLWYRGIFSVGRHNAQGKFTQRPVNEPVRGMGPRELIFPEALQGRLADVPLLGDLKRYLLCLDTAPCVPAAAGEAVALFRPEDNLKPLWMKVDTLALAVPRPLLDRQGTPRSRGTTPVFSMSGSINNGGNAFGRKLTVPISELSWRTLGFVPTSAHGEPA
jgi:hypothetical protein